MRLGVVGICGDFRKLNQEEIAAVQELRFTGVSFHYASSAIPLVSFRLRIVMDFVNHFQTLRQVYESESRLNHIFDVMGHIAPMAHIKDIRVENGLVLHLNEEVAGEGELALDVALKRFDALYPDGYGLIEHLPIEKILIVTHNVRKIAVENGINIY